MAHDVKEAPATADPVRAELKAVLEALIFASPEPVTMKALVKLLDGETKDEILRAIESLKRDYERPGGLQIVEVVVVADLGEDARPLARKVDQISGRRGPFILASMIRLALNKYAISRSAPDVGEVVRTQAEVEQGRLVTSMSTVQYLTWAIPAIGFLGTVRGLAGGMTMASVKNDAMGVQEFIKHATDQLTVAFDCRSSYGSRAPMNWTRICGLRRITSAITR